MIRALFTSATGMNVQSTTIDNTAMKSKTQTIYIGC